MIEAVELTRSYGRLRAVDGLSFSVPKGAICGFLGPNGAGKSTTIRMIAGLFPPDSGRLVVGGVDVGENPLQARRQVGYLPESTPLDTDLRVTEYLRFRGRLVGMGGADLSRAIDRSLELCGLEGVRRRLIGALSKGYRQRVGLGAALLADPPLLVLDEPTVGLDPTQQQAFRGLLSGLAGDRTVLLSSHLLGEVQASCTWLVMISGGRLVAEGPREEILGGATGVPTIIELRAEEATTFQSKVRGLQGIADTSLEPLDAGWSRLKVIASDGKDHREELAELAGKADLRLRELRRDLQTLESVFMALSRTHGETWDQDRPASAGEEAS